MNTIRYSVTRGDLAAGFLIWLCRNRTIWIGFALLSAFIGYSTFHDPHLFKYRTEVRAVMWILPSLGLFLFVFAGTFLICLGKLLGNTKGILGEHSVSVGEEGLRETTAYNEMFMRWATYHKTVKTPGYLLLFPNSISFLILSRKRPLLEGNLEDFEADLEKFSKAGKE